MNQNLEYCSASLLTPISISYCKDTVRELFWIFQKFVHKIFLLFYFLILHGLSSAILSFTIYRALPKSFPIWDAIFFLLDSAKHHLRIFIRLAYRFKYTSTSKFERWCWFCPRLGSITMRSKMLCQNFMTWSSNRFLNLSDSQSATGKHSLVDVGRSRRVSWTPIILNFHPATFQPREPFVRPSTTSSTHNRSLTAAFGLSVKVI